MLTDQETNMVMFYLKNLKTERILCDKHKQLRDTRLVTKSTLGKNLY